MGILKRRKAIDKASGVDLAPEEPWLMKKWPNVYHWLTDTTYEDGGARQPGKIAFKAQDGLFCGTVSDEDGRASTYVSADTIQACLDAMERAIADESTRWITWPSARAQKGKK